MNIKEPWGERSRNNTDETVDYKAMIEYEYFKPIAVAEWKSLCTGGSPMHAWETEVTNDWKKKDNWTRCKIYQEFPCEVGQVQPVHVLPKPEWIVLELCFSDTLNVVHYVMQNLSIISS